MSIKQKISLACKDRVRGGPNFNVLSHPNTPYCVRYQYQGTRKQKHFANPEQVLSYFNELRKIKSSEGMRGLQLDSAARAEFYAARELALAHGLSTMDAVRLGCQMHNPVSQQLKFNDMIDAFLATKEKRNVTERTYRNLKYIK